jgi:hypothetical protein
MNIPLAAKQCCRGGDLDPLAFVDTVVEIAEVSTPLWSGKLDNVVFRGRMVELAREICARMEKWR